MKLFASAAIAAVLLTAGAASAATNLVQNGSFEQPPLGFAWQYSGVSYGGGGAGVGTNPATIINYNSPTGYPTGAYGEAVPPDNSVSSSPDAVGSHAAYFVADDSVETLSQLVTLAAGHYKVGFSVYLPGNGVNNPIDAKFKGSIGDTVLANFSAKSGPLNAQQWYNYSGTRYFAAGQYLISFDYDTRVPGSVANKFGPAGYGADVVVDRVYAIGVAVPEPATWAMMIGGFGMAGAMIRRRKAAIA